MDDLTFRHRQALLSIFPDKKTAICYPVKPRHSCSREILQCGNADNMRYFRKIVLIFVESPIKVIKKIQAKKNIYYIVLEVESQKLENLRKKYGLNAKLKGHEFHISIAKKIIKK